MPRQGRLDFPEAIHYVRVLGRKGTAVFLNEGALQGIAGEFREDPADIHRLEFLLARACAESGSVVHAYCWLPRAAVIVVQRFDMPLELIMGTVFGQYSRYLHREGRIPREQTVYGSRYDSKAIAPMYLPYAVRRAHKSPLEAGLCARTEDYPFSSAGTYAGKSYVRWVTTTAVCDALQQRGYRGQPGYHTFMEKAESQYVKDLFDRGSRWDSRVVGDRAFVREANHRAMYPRPAPSREELIDAVACLIAVSPTLLYQRAPAGVLGRALVAWYATRSGAATLSDVGRWFSRSASTLRRDIDKQRAVKPSLFALSTRELFNSRISDRSSGTWAAP